MPLLRRVAPFTHELLLFLILIGMLITYGIMDRDFLAGSNQQLQFFNIWDIALLAIPMTLIIVTGGIDLSVGSMMGLCAVVMGMLYDAKVPIAVAATAAVLTGVTCGFLNGIFVTRIRVHPLIVTLATLSLYRGLAEGLSLALAPALGLKTVYGNFPESFKAIGKHAFFAGPPTGDAPVYAISSAGWLFVLLSIAVAVILARTPFGRTLYAIGYNEKAALFSGMKVDRAKLAIYTFSGLMAGLATINYSGRNNNARAAIGEGIELDVITAVVLGGTSIFGGRGRIIGTVLGVALIHETREFVSFHFKQNELIRVVLGALLLIAVAANALLTRRSGRK